MTMNPLFARLGVPADIDTLAGIERLVRVGASETRHLDFKRQVHHVDDLADDLSALANVGGGVLVVGIGTDHADRAVSLHEQDLRVVEQQAVQAARDGIDEPLHIEPIAVPGNVNPAKGFLVVAVPPSDRAPHISAKKGRVLHRVGTHNKPMTRRELGAAFATSGELFAIEFGLTRVYGSAAVTCELLDSTAGMINTIKVVNTGMIPALEISINSTTSQILWAKDTPHVSDESWSLSDMLGKDNHVPDPPYLPIQILPSGANVVLRCWREWGSPQQDVLQVIWKTPDGQLHRNEQSWSWTPASIKRR